MKDLKRPTQSALSSDGALIFTALALGLLMAVIVSLWFRQIESHARDDMHGVLEAVAAESEAVTNGFFAGPERAGALASNLEPELRSGSAIFDRLLTDLIALDDAIDGAFVGFPNGDFEFVAIDRSSDEPGFRFRSIDAGPDRRVQLRWTDADLREQRSEFADDADDPYDPRQRPWYGPIADGAPTHWTAPYTFASSGEPGITFSMPVLVDNRPAAVVGIDVRLTDLVDFLDNRRPTSNGRALIVDRAGAIVAAPSGTSVDSKELAALIAANPGGGAFSHGEGRTASLRPLQRDWYLFVDAPDRDFVAIDGRLINLFTLVGAVALAALLASLGRNARRRVNELQLMARHDALTGLFDRAESLRRAGQLLRTHYTTGGSTIGIVDLDKFKEINDAHGHRGGDLALAEAARRLDEVAAGVGWTVGRLGGDEFIAFGVRSSGGGDHVWKQMVAAMNEPFTIDGATVMLSCSIGSANQGSFDSAEMADYLARADERLYLAKEHGRGCWVGSDEPALTR